MVINVLQNQYIEIIIYHVKNVHDNSLWNAANVNFTYKQSLNLNLHWIYDRASNFFEYIKEVII